MPARDLGDGGHVGYIARVMHRHNRFRSRCNRSLDFRSINDKAVLAIHKDGVRTGHHNRTHRGDKCGWCSNHLVARPNAQNLQRQNECVCATRHPDSMRHLAQFSKTLFKFNKRTPQSEIAGSDQFLDITQIRADLGKLPIQVGKWHTNGVACPLDHSL